MYLAKIYVTLKPTVNDPQGQTVLASLKTLGFSSASSVRVGKYLEVRLNESDHQQAEAHIHTMCAKLLANPIIENFTYHLKELAETES